METFPSNHLLCGEKLKWRIKNMSDMPQTPNLASGAPIAITKKQIFSLDCPKCKKPLDVTNLTFGTNIECPNCSNITWRPEFKLGWVFKLKNLIISVLLSFILGVGASLIATYIYKKFSVENPPSTPEQIEEIQ